MTRELTGWHVLGIFGGAFAVIIAVNLTLAVNAVRSFPGLETRNAYIASQSFDARRAAQQALGWEVAARPVPGGLRLAITDRAGQPPVLEITQAVLGRATHVKADRALVFAFDGMGWGAEADLSPGQWVLRLRARAGDGTVFEQRVPVYVPQALVEQALAEQGA